MKKKSNTKIRKSTKVNVVSKANQIKKGIPVGVKIISVLYFILAFFVILVGLFFIISKSFINEIYRESPELAELGTGGFIILGVILVLLGALFIFLGLKLWKRKNWARIVTVVFSILMIIIYLIDILFASSNLIVNIFWIIVYGIITGYLLFSKDARNSFK